MSVAAVFVGATGCNGDKAAPVSQAVVAAAATGSDVDSGCAHGALLVKVLIDLHQEKDHCVPEVTPASVCVAPKGVVRFKIKNGCGDLGRKSKALEIKVQKFKKSASSQPETPRTLQIFENCLLVVPQINKDSNPVVHCDIAEGATYGFYKYSLNGDEIDTLDPDVEVRGAN